MKGLKLAGVGFLAVATAALVLMVGLLGSQVSAEDQELVVGSADGVAGEEVVVEVAANEIEEPGLGGWDIEIAYDAAVVSVVACDAGTAGGINSLLCEADDGTVEVAGIAPGGLVGDVVLASITLSCDAVGATDLEPEVLELVDAAEGDPQAIDVGEKLVAGVVTCGEAATATPTATATAVPPTATATPPAATATPKPDKGDVNCDTVVDPVDAKLILQLDAREIEEFPC